MKRDIKYIIKRIIIGVAIAFIFSTINKCNAYAQTINVKLQQNNPVISFPQSTSGLYSLFELDSPYSNNIYNYYSIFNVSENKKYYAIFKDNTNNIYLYLIFNNFTNSYANIDFSKVNLSKFTDLGSTYYTYQFYNNDTDEFTTIGGFTYGFVITDNINTDFSNIFISTPTKYNSPITDEYFYTNGSQPQLSENIFENFELFQTNLLYLSIDNNVIKDSTMSLIEMEDNQAVVFVPKNYNDIQIETVQTGGSPEYPIYTNFIDFNFYYQGYFRNGYFPLNNTDDITYGELLTNEDLKTYVDSYFPMYQDGSQQSGYGYYAYILFNRAYYGGKVWYNSTLFNYVLVPNLQDSEVQICYINRYDENNCTNLSFHKSIEDIFDESFNEGGDDWDHPEQDYLQDTIGLFDLLKLPFDFLIDISNSTCHPIQIPFPYSNQYITINCLSPLFYSILGGFYDTLKIVISALVIYRVIILDIHCITSIIYMKTDKLEVVDL